MLWFFAVTQTVFHSGLAGVLYVQALHSFFAQGNISLKGLSQYRFFLKIELSL